MTVEELLKKFEEAVDHVNYSHAREILNDLEVAEKSYKYKLWYTVLKAKLNRLTTFSFDIIVTKDQFDEIREIGDDVLLAQAFIEYACYQVFTGDLEYVGKLLSTYKDTILSVDDPQILGYYYNLSGAYKASQRDHRGAVEDFQKSLEYRKKAGNSLLIAQSYNNLSSSYYELDQEEQAIENGIKAVDLTREVERGLYHLHYQRSLQSAYLKFGRMEEAKSILEKMEARYTETNDLETAKILFKLAKAQYLYHSDKLLDKMKAKELYADIVSRGVKIIQYSLQAIIFYCELTLMELETTGSSLAFEEVKQAIKKLSELAEFRNSIHIQIQAGLLESKLELTQGKFDRGYNLLEDLLEFAKNHKLDMEVARIEEEMSRYESHIKELQLMIDRNVNISDRIRKMRLREYINNAREIGFN